MVRKKFSDFCPGSAYDQCGSTAYMYIYMSTIAINASPKGKVDR